MLTQQNKNNKVQKESNVLTFDNLYSPEWKTSTSKEKKRKLHELI